MFITFVLLIGLAIDQLKVPPEANLGGQAVLECGFLLGNWPLYSVKWYKEDHEFFRFMPDNSPQITMFPVEGVEVDEHQSDMHQVVLRNLTGKSEGLYKCEVSTEGPIFDTVYKSANMNIVAFPDRIPEIRLEKTYYELNEEIRANCTSGKSYPPTSLTWFINGVKAETSCVHAEDPLRVGKGLYRTRSRLIFKSNGNPGIVTITCIGTIPRIVQPTRISVKIYISKPVQYDRYSLDSSNDKSGTRALTALRTTFDCFHLIISNILLFHLFSMWNC